jgi:predicted nucleic acid-binding protein
LEGVDVRGFERILGTTVRIGLDTPVLIYHFEDISPYAELTTRILGSIAAGTRVIVSVISVAEILTGPWRERQADRARIIEEGVQALPGLTVRDVTWKTAASAAELRGTTSLPLPDALIVASLLEGEAQVIVTNDASWKSAKLPCRVLLLDDYLT